MKVLYLIDSLNRGGKERRLLALINNLPNTIEFGIVLLKNEIQFDVENIKDNIYTCEGKSRTKKLFWISKFIRNWKPNIVHSWYHECSRYALPVCKINGIRFITSEITNIAPPFNSKYSFTSLAFKIVFNMADKITSNSAAGLKAYKVPEEKGIVVYNGFDFKRVKNYLKDSVENQTEENETFKILMIANFTAKKDYDSFLQVAINILDKRRDLVFVGLGSGTLHENYVSRIPEHLKNHILFPGFTEDIEKEISTSDIGVLASFGEGVPNSIMEFMAQSKPVVVTSGGGTIELVVNNKTGILVPQRNIYKLQTAIEYLITHDNIRKKMGEMGYLRLKEKFSVEKMVLNFISLYNEVL